MSNSSACASFAKCRAGRSTRRWSASASRWWWIFMLLARRPYFLCSPSYPVASPFKLIDITGAGHAGDFLLRDHNGVTRSLKDFNGEVAVVFFGFTHPTSAQPP
jgi:hypothetical protein